jgi:hypothetical protein
MIRRPTVTEIADAEQDWFWSDDWQAGEREAEADLAAGRLSEFEQAEEAIRFLRAGCGDTDERPDGLNAGKDQI